MPGAPESSPVEGEVIAWDEARGIGTVRTRDGHDLDLQCTNLLDGSRTTTVGTRVAVRPAPGHHGRWQALDVVTVAPHLRA